MAAKNFQEKDWTLAQGRSCRRQPHAMIKPMNWQKRIVQAWCFHGIFFCFKINLVKQSIFSIIVSRFSKFETFNKSLFLFKNCKKFDMSSV